MSYFANVPLGCDVSSWELGAKQLAAWHRRCRIEREIRESKKRIKENAEILAWAKERGRRMKEAANEML